MMRTLHLERPAFWTEPSDPEAWFRALEVLAAKPPEAGSPRAVADRALAGVISRRGALGVFGLVEDLLPGVGLVTRDTDGRWTVSDEAQVLLRHWTAAPTRGTELLAAFLVREGAFNTPLRGITVYAGTGSLNGVVHDLLIHDAHDPENPVTYVAKSGTTAIVEGELALILRDGQILFDELDSMTPTP